MSITKRWLRGGLLLTLMAVAAVEIFFLYSTRVSMYNGVRQSIRGRFSTINAQLEITISSTDAATVNARSLALRRMVEQFDAKESYEFMLLDSQGRIISTSSGQIENDLFSNEDFSLALESVNGVGESIYRTARGERVLSMTMLVPYPVGEIAAMRMVTSLTLVDQAIDQYALTSLLVASVVVGASLLSGLYFIRSIVQPLARVEATATQIARGDLEVRLPPGPYEDEVGRLCRTINQMAEDLGKTERMKNDFISSVSHELRTPLTSIKGWIETISAIRDPEDENYRKGIAIIGQEADRLYNMVEELLNFSRLQNGVQLACESLDLVAEVTDVALFVQPRMNQEGINLDYQEPELMVPVWADPNRLRQVLVNVLDNAIKYSKPGSTIHLELLSEVDNVYICIREEGRGIAPDDRENVKLKFFKGKNAERGSGIGLAVVEEIVTAMNGEVEIASQLGEGTTVTIRLPHYSQPQGAPEE